VFVLGILEIQCKIRCDRPSDLGDRPVDCDRLVGHSWCTLSLFIS